MNESSVSGMRPDVAQLLGEMRQIREQIASPAGVGDNVVNAAERGDSASNVDFSELLTSAIDQVNAVQKESGRLATAYQQGDPDVTLAQVVIASEKSGVAFEAMTEIRNRLVNAYEDVMNMPI